MAEALNELPDDVYDQVTRLSEEGNDFLDKGDTSSAAQAWGKALMLLPPPEKHWEAAVWLHASIGAALREEGNFDAALPHFQSAYASADGHLNPYVLANLGATLYDTGRHDEATDPLLRAYMLEGDEIFEDFGDRYLDHLRSKGLIDQL